MLRVLLALLFLSTLIFAQSLRAEKDERLGGYQHVEKTMTNQNKEMEGLREIEAFARNEFAKSNSGEYLGPLVDVQRQVVAGFNYKLTFESNSRRVDVFVFDQPWSSTR